MSAEARDRGKPGTRMRSWWTTLLVRCDSGFELFLSETIRGLERHEGVRRDAGAQLSGTGQRRGVSDVPRSPQYTTVWSDPGILDGPTLHDRLRHGRVWNLDTHGRLLSFERIPPQFEKLEPARRPPPEWKPLFRRPGSTRRLHPAEPCGFPVGIDTRPRGRDHGRAADGAGGGRSLARRPVYFDVIGPWTCPVRMPGSG